MLDFIYIAVSEAWVETTDTIARLSKTLSAFARDLELLSSLYIARFIVWRELRKRREQKRVA